MPRHTLAIIGDTADMRACRSKPFDWLPGSWNAVPFMGDS
jgi:hypothetical protein